MCSQRKALWLILCFSTMFLKQVYGEINPDLKMKGKLKETLPINLCHSDLN